MMLAANNRKNKNSEKLLIEPKRFKRKETKIKKGVYLEQLDNEMAQEAERLLRIPQYIHGILNTIEKIENAESVYKHFYPKARENPIRACLMVGSLARSKVGHLDVYYDIKERIKEIPKKEYAEKTLDILRRYVDFDGSLILKNTTNPQVLGSRFLKMLPDITRGDFEGYEFHDDGIKTEREFLQTFELFESSKDYVDELKKREKEILLKDKNKSIKPVIIWESKKLDKRIKEKFDEYVENHYLTRLDQYLGTTWEKYRKEFEKEFPDEYEDIVIQIGTEAVRLGFTKEQARSYLRYYTEI